MVADGKVHAFNIRANLRSLFVVPPNHLRSLDAWRTLAMFWIILHHSILALAPKADLTSLRVISGFAAFRVFYHASFAVDIFFVLSGFLIGGIIIRELDRTGQINWLRFYGRRILRMLPIYYCVLLLTFFIVRFDLVRLPNESNIWANFLQINNFLPYRNQFMRWTWSLAIEEQFYLLCPILLFCVYRGGKVFFGSMVFLMASMISIHAFLLLHTGTPLYWSISHEIDFTAYSRYFDIIYDKPYIRFTSLFIGMLGAHFYEKGMIKKIFSRKHVGAFLTFSAALLLYSVFSFIDYRAGQETKNIFYLIFYREVFSCSILILIFSSLYFSPLKSIFSLGIFYPLFQLSYGAYLIHFTIARIILQNYFGPSIDLGFFTFMHVFLLSIVVFLMSLACALPLYLFVEKPIMNLRKKVFP